MTDRYAILWETGGNKHGNAGMAGFTLNVHGKPEIFDSLGALAAGLHAHKPTLGTSSISPRKLTDDSATTPNFMNTTPLDAAALQALNGLYKHGASTGKFTAAQRPGNAVRAGNPVP